MRIAARRRAFAAAGCAAALLLDAGVAGAASFQIETVDAQNFQNLGQYASLALDSRDNPHIAYYDATSQDLKYARKIGGTWMVEVVDSGNLTGAFASLALDGNDAPHIAYYNAEAGFLRYAEKTSGSWMTETVPDTGIYGSWCSITIGEDGNPVVAYRHDTDDNLSVKRKDGTWTFAGGSGNPGDGFHTDITLGPDNHFFVSHYTSPGLALLWEGMNFTAIQFIDAAGDVGQYSSIAVGPDGAVHISYHDETNSDLKYATNSAATPTTWNKEIVDDGGGVDDVGEWTSIALDESGEPHITYYNATDQVLQYAVRQGAFWDFEKVDLSTDDHGQYSSLALDSHGNPHVAYYDSDEQGLRYAGGGVKLFAPAGGETMAVGSLMDVWWFGAGPVVVRLATNGTDFDHELAANVFTPPARVQVPHLPTRFARVKIVRSTVDFSSSTSDSFFTIDASVIVSNLKASVVGSSAVLTWETQPGPEAGIRYRVQRSIDDGAWEGLHAGLLQAPQFTDSDAPAGALYRVTAVNGLGGETILGDVRALPAMAAGRLLAVTPNPAPGGDALVLFRAHPSIPVQIQVYDVRGALVRTLYSGAGSETGWARWDGLYRNGARAHSGVYFVRLRSPAGLSASERLIVVR